MSILIFEYSIIILSLSLINQHFRYTTYRSLYRVITKAVSGVLDGLNEGCCLHYFTSCPILHVCRLYAILVSDRTAKNLSRSLSPPLFFALQIGCSEIDVKLGFGLE